MKNLFVRFVREEEGQDLIEYSLLAAIIAVGAIAAMTTVSMRSTPCSARSRPLSDSGS